MANDIQAGGARRNRHRPPAFIPWLLWFLAGIGVGWLASSRWSSEKSASIPLETGDTIREETGAVIAITMENTEWKDFHDRFGPCWLVARSTGHPPVLLPIDHDGKIHDPPPPGRWCFTFACHGLASEDHRPWELWVRGGNSGHPAPLTLDFPTMEETTVSLRLPGLSTPESVDFKTRETYYLGFLAKTPETIQSLLALNGWPLLPSTVECAQRLAIRSSTHQEATTAPARLMFHLEEKETPGIQSISETFSEKLIADRQLPDSEMSEIRAMESIADMVGFFQPRLSRAKNRAEFMFWKSLQELKWLSMNSQPIPPKVSPMRVHLLADTGRYLYRLPNAGGGDDFLWQDRHGARFSSRDGGCRESLLLSPPGFDIILLAGQSSSALPRIESMPTQPSN